MLKVTAEVQKLEEKELRYLATAVTTPAATRKHPRI